MHISLHVSVYKHAICFYTTSSAGLRGDQTSSHKRLRSTSCTCCAARPNCTAGSTLSRRQSKAPTARRLRRSRKWAASASGSDLERLYVSYNGSTSIYRLYNILYVEVVIVIYIIM